MIGAFGRFYTGHLFFYAFFFKIIFCDFMIVSPFFKE